MSIIPSFFKNAVVPVGLRQADSSVRWIGTGFFVVRQINESEGTPFLISNRHVLEGHSQITISMKEQGTNALRLADIDLVETGKPKYVLHHNPQIDIAILPLDGDFITNNNLEFPYFNIDVHAMTSSELRSHGVDDGSLVHMLGFPLGLVNDHSMLPICRLGCIARISEDQIKESNNILVDIQNFPGNSGSPVILRPEIAAIEGTGTLTECVLIGIIHSYIPYKDVLLSNQTQEIVEIRSENSGIANAHPVEFIREIIDGIVPPYTPPTSSN